MKAALIRMAAKLAPALNMAPALALALAAGCYYRWFCTPYGCWYEVVCY